MFFGALGYSEESLTILGQCSAWPYMMCLYCGIFIKVRSVTQFHDISSLTLPEMADLLLTHELHILVDLMGFSTGGRPELLALKPSPLQIAYMGYPGVCIVCAVQHLNIRWYTFTVTHNYTGTTGSSFIDYVLCDPTACSPATIEDQFTEKIIFLPEPYFIAPMVPPRPPQITLDGEKKNV